MRVSRTTKRRRGKEGRENLEGLLLLHCCRTIQNSRGRRRVVVVAAAGVDGGVDESA